MATSDPKPGLMRDISCFSCSLDLVSISGIILASCDPKVGIIIDQSCLEGAASPQAPLDDLNKNLKQRDEELRLAKEEAASERLAKMLAEEEAVSEKLAKIKAKSRHNTDVADWDKREKEVRKEYVSSKPPITVDHIPTDPNFKKGPPPQNKPLTTLMCTHCTKTSPQRVQNPKEK